ncbi:M13-type metalloendopeptidase [Mesoterricola silvestris]|uniref:M13 family peptidase n=1 Tax=Mesoterricola silvestris TaxID=2927979 RepID=A0AA48GHM2_9BACT|nr:M13 family metallopeptidase [Mesoterricola silvestris]BDU71397.1 hypothetical protein METEAL_05710 [Mesoterricola silvestris]
MIRAARFLLPGLVAGVLGAQVHGIRTADLDPSGAPCGDFFRFANGGWARSNPVPPDRASWGALDEARARAEEVLREAAEEAAASLAPEGSVPRQVGDFYASGMDTAAIARAGLGPLREGLARVDAVRDPRDLGPEFARLHALGAGAGFLLTVGPEPGRPALDIAHLSPGGLGMPVRDYLAEEGRGRRAAYLDYLARLFSLAGESPALARAHAGIAFDLERRLAGAQARDAAPRRMTREELAALAPRFPWQAYFQAVGLASEAELRVAQPEFLAELSGMAGDTPAPPWRTYLKARLLDAGAPFLGEAFENAAMAFRGGAPEMRGPRWRRVVRATDAALGEALGQMYVARTCSLRCRARAQALAGQVRSALGKGLRDRGALARLGALEVRAGYPEAWPDFSALRVEREGFLANVQRAAAWRFRSQVARAGRPADPARWPVAPTAVEVVYDPVGNQLLLPAGVLQPPFFDPRADDAVNFGGLGVLIARELGRGLLEEKGESAGVEAAFAGLEKALEGRPREALDGFTPAQRFFLAFARSRRQAGPAEASRLAVNAALARVPAFAAAFGCGSPQDAPHP